MIRIQALQSSFQNASTNKRLDSREIRTPAADAVERMSVRPVRDIGQYLRRPLPDPRSSGGQQSASLTDQLGNASPTEQDRVSNKTGRLRSQLGVCTHEIHRASGISRCRVGPPGPYLVILGGVVAVVACSGGQDQFSLLYGTIILMMILPQTVERRPRPSVPRCLAGGTAHC